MISKNNEPYLEHYGILGMKWGVRRYQNKDGSLTIAGKNRRKKSSLVTEKKQGTKKAKGKRLVSELNPPNKRTSISKGNLSVMTDISDEELDSAIRRMQKISQYNQLNTQVYPKSKGQRFVDASKDVLASSAKQVGTWAATALGKYAVKRMVGKAYNYDIFGDPKKTN